MSENSIKNIMDVTMDKLRAMVDANTIIGAPIDTKAGTTIIPVSKVSVGLASGGVDYASKTERADKNSNFGGGGGTGVSVVPIGFLTVDSEGKVDMININNPGNDIGSSIESIVEKLPAIMDKLKETFEKKKEEKKSEEAVENAENAESSEAVQDKDSKPEKSFKIKAAKAE